ncbi:acyl-CoA dehydrogenase [Micromonospora sp. NPDC050417]|uniref:acyl-CoA dehydrogenase family protein n=1 Tax=Micromonospora sp. NPDC050417 TaxID=3364280 RepID=UPI0037B03570
MVNALTDLVYDHQYEGYHNQVQQIFADENFRPVDGLSMPARAMNSYAMLRHAATRIGKATEVARNPRLLLAFYEWACTHVPDLLPLISGHYNLTVSSLLTLGGDRDDLRPYLDQLDTADSVGVMLINEYGCGSNVAFLETTATYDHSTRSFLLNTPNPGARKFMPNVGAAVPRVTVVVARLVIDGVAHGIFPFVAQLRDADGNPAPGVDIMPMPDKPFFPMDNAVTSFNNVRVPFSGWLSAGIAEIDREGRFAFAPGMGPHSAFRLTASQFTFGRVALSAAAVASARAATLILARYVQTRGIRAFHGHRRPMLEFQNVQHSLFGALATTYACTFFVNDMKADLVRASNLGDPDIQLAGIVAKSYLVTASQRVIQECRERCGAHAMFSVNRIADYLGLCQGSLTAEGDIQVLRLTAGRHLALGSGYAPPAVETKLVEAYDDPLDWLHLFQARESHLYDRVAKNLRGPLGEGTVFDRWNRCIPDAMRLTESYAERRALESFLKAIAAAPVGNPRIALRLTAKLFVLGHVRSHGGFYLANGHLSPEAFDRIESEYAETCQELTEHLPLLVDAFAIDESILDAPITAPDRIAAWEERSKEVRRLWEAVEIAG